SAPSKWSNRLRRRAPSRQASTGGHFHTTIPLNIRTGHTHGHLTFPPFHNRKKREVTASHSVLQHTPVAHMRHHFHFSSCAGMVASSIRCSIFSTCFLFSSSVQCRRWAMQSTTVSFHFLTQLI